MSFDRPVLLVHAADAVTVPFLENAVSLIFQFSNEADPGGLSAWWSEESDSVRGRYAARVLERCKGLDGGFSQQALNRLFAQILVEQRPAVVLVMGVYGCTVDLPRVANLMGVPTVWAMGAGDAEPLADLPVEGRDAQWLSDALNQATARIRLSPATPLPEALAGVAWQEESELAGCLARVQDGKAPWREFDYASYEFCLRDHPLLVSMQQADVAHFQGCQRVLDLGCGAGIFLDLLGRAGISAQGVERSPAIARYGQGMGLDIINEDALEFLNRSTATFDGIYCAHFVEHLPFDVVHALLKGLAARLEQGGLLVLVFPDPESIRSQLLGFWRDPEHVRFYHPELIMTLASTLGLSCEWHSHQDQVHEVGPFSMHPAPMPDVPEHLLALPGGLPPPGRWERLLAWFGLASARHQQLLARQLADLHQAAQQSQAMQNAWLQQMSERSETLWRVNQTWAWQDNAVLRLRKR